MKNILVLGAGRSASTLIRYLLRHAQTEDWHLIVADRDLELAQQKVAGADCAEAVFFDVRNQLQTRREVARADVVVSMLPASLHMGVAKACLEYARPLVTASYVSEEMQALDREVSHKGLLFLNEMGLDPGIDHLSAMKVLDELRQSGARVTLFKSYAGGLIAPEADTNPWRYKFTWNPRNVVLAGQGTARFIERQRHRFVPYHRIFKTLEPIVIEGVDKFEGYPNRNSLAYRHIYGLEDVPTLQRGTIRYEGFCQKWDALVQLGLTEDSYVIEDSAHMSYRDFTAAFLPADEPDLKKSLSQLLGLKPYGETLRAIEWLGLLDAERPIGLEAATPAAILQQLLEEKWKLGAQDRDMIVMQHKFGYELEGKVYLRYDSLVAYGEDTEQTAMAKCVGLPLGIAVRNILAGTFAGVCGVCRPVVPAIYNPALKELAEHGITFTERLEASTPDLVGVN